MYALGPKTPFQDFFFLLASFEFASFLVGFTLVDWEKSPDYGTLIDMYTHYNSCDFENFLWRKFMGL